MSRKFTIFWLVVIPDTVLLFISLWLSVFLRYKTTLNSELWTNHLNAFSVIFVLWLAVFNLYGIFDVASFRRYTVMALNLLTAMLINILVAVVYFYFQPDLILTPRRFLLINGSIAFMLILFWHLIVKYNLKNRLIQNIYLFSFNRELSELEEAIKQQSYLGYKVIGHLNEQSLEKMDFLKGSGIVLPEALAANPKVMKKFYELRKLGVEFYNHKYFYENLLRKVYLSQINEVWFLENIAYKEKRFYNFLKRILDLIFGLVGFVFFLITLPVIALLIKLDSKGTIFFIQPRVGKQGKIFKVYKYRTMAGGSTDTWTMVNDSRITFFGKFLRKSRLDELPQFINLVLGNMSLVGPRPEQLQIVEDLKNKIPFFDERHLVKPGITGWAQLNVYASTVEESMEKLQYDLYYVKNRGIVFDLEIILKTFYYIFTWQGR